jgi:hypothetical protein
VPDAVCRYIEDQRLYQMHKSADDRRDTIVDNRDQVIKG